MQKRRGQRIDKQQTRTRLFQKRGALHQFFMSGRRHYEPCALF
jgi:hypothetical protein